MGQQQRNERRSPGLNQDESNRDRSRRTVDEDLANEGASGRKGGKGAENDPETAGRNPSGGKNGSAGRTAG